MNRYFYLEDENSASFLRAMDDSIEMHRMRARLGEIEVHDLRQDLTASDILHNIQQASQHGYREVDEAEFGNRQIEARMEFERKIVEPSVADQRLVPWNDLKAEHRETFRNDPAELLSPRMQMFCVYDQACRLTGPFKLAFDSDAPTVQTARRNLLFNEGVTVDGNFDAGDCTTELPLLIIVKGDMHVKNLILSGWAEMVVTGNLVVADTLFGFDGEAGGRLHVQGNLSAQRILGGMMYSIEVAGQLAGDVYWCDLDEATLPGASMVPYTLSSQQAIDFGKYTPLVNEAYFADSNWATGGEVLEFNFNASQIVELIRQGKPIFR